MRARSATIAVYTPEMIVQGRLALDGGLEDVRRHLADATKTQLARVELERTSNKTTVRVDATPASSTGDTREVWLAVTESDLASNVEGGENRGKELLHGPIVRKLVKVGVVSGSSFVGSVDVAARAALASRGTCTSSDSYRNEFAPYSRGENPLTFRRAQ